MAIGDKRARARALAQQTTQHRQRPRRRRRHVRRRRRRRHRRCPRDHGATATAHVDGTERARACEKIEGRARAFSPRAPHGRRRCRRRRRRDVRGGADRCRGRRGGRRRGGGGRVAADALGALPRLLRAPPVSGGAAARTRQTAAAAAAARLQLVALPHLNGAARDRAHRESAASGAQVAQTPIVRRRHRAALRVSASLWRRSPLARARAQFRSRLWELHDASRPSAVTFTLARAHAMLRRAFHPPATRPRASVTCSHSSRSRLLQLRACRVSDDDGGGEAAASSARQ